MELYGKKRDERRAKMRGVGGVLFPSVCAPNPDCNTSLTKYSRQTDLPTEHVGNMVGNEIWCLPADGEFSGTNAYWKKASGPRLLNLTDIPSKWQTKISQMQRNGFFSHYLALFNDPQTAPLTQEDTNTYFRCVLEKGSAVVWSAPVKVIVFDVVLKSNPGSPTVQIIPDIEIGASLLLKCIDPRRYDVKPAGFQDHLSSRWEHDLDLFAVRSNSDNIISVHDILYIAPLSTASLGDYKCHSVYTDRPSKFPQPQFEFEKLTGEYRLERASAARSDVPFVPLHLVRTSEELISTYPGERVNVFCLFSPGQNGFPQVYWEFQNPTNTIPARISNSGSANRNAQVSFIATEALRGTIKCSAAGSFESKVFTLTVFSRLKLVSQEKMRDRLIRVKDSVTLDCSLTTTPQRDAVWYFNAVPIDYATKTSLKLSAGSSRLTISNAAKSDAGVYACHASNVFTASVWNAAVYVFDSPGIVLSNNVSNLPTINLNLMIDAAAERSQFSPTPVAAFQLTARYFPDRDAKRVHIRWYKYTDEVRELLSTSHSFISEVKYSGDTSTLVFRVVREVDLHSVVGQYRAEVQYENNPDLTFLSFGSVAVIRPEEHDSSLGRVSAGLFIVIAVIVFVSMTGCALGLIYGAKGKLYLRARQHPVGANFDDMDQQQYDSAYNADYTGPDANTTINATNEYGPIDPSADPSGLSQKRGPSGSILQ